MRSFHFRDGISVSLNNKSSETLESFSQGVRLIHYFSDDHWPHEDIEPQVSQPAEILTVPKMAHSMKWHSERFEDALSEYEETWPWRQGFFGFEVAQIGRMALYYEWKQTAYTIPYWSIVLPPDRPLSFSAPHKAPTFDSGENN